MNPKIFFGLGMGFLIGLGCSFLKIPIPAPPVLDGSLLVVAMTLGYTLVDRFFASKLKEQNNLSNCGGPIINPKQGNEK